MAMFDKPIAGTESAMSPGTIVGGNVKLTGTLKDVNDITVHGQVDGVIISDRVVTIAETARVKGPVTATTVMVAGTVNGDVTASERCELLPSARVTGSVTAGDLSIKSGAIFNGKATMTAPADRPEPTKNEMPEPEESVSEPEAESESVKQETTMDDADSAPSAATDETLASEPEPSSPTTPTAELED